MLTPKERAEAIALWESGSVTLEQLAKKYGKTVGTFAKLFAKAGVKRGSKAEAMEKKVAAELEKTATAEARIIADRIRETKNNAYRLASGIEKLIAFEINEAQKDKVHISTRKENVKTLKVMADTIAQTWNIRAAILNLDKEDNDDHDLPELRISELTVEQIKKMVAQDSINSALDNELDALDALPNPVDPVLDAQDDKDLETVQ